ncbi:hypothetical protein [Endozoicomonas sp. ALB091]|uniref:hypothetical protein n=1 Tax=Endozoicomonas sp. ALB091 TaxID=3403073 RepID=UPI003BB6C6EB
MIPSEYNLFRCEPASSGAGINKSETHDTLLQSQQDPAHATVTDSLSRRTVEPKFTNNYLGSSGFSSAFFDTGSQEYLLLVKAIGVMEKGPAFNEDKLGPVSRKKMTVAQLRKKKRELKAEEDKKLSELEYLTVRILYAINTGKEIRQQDIACILEILSDFYSSRYFMNCMFFIIHKVLSDQCAETNMVLTEVVKNQCGGIIELIYKIVLSRDDVGLVSEFWYVGWDLYYVFNIIACCVNLDGSERCAPFFSPELPVKLALKCLQQMPGVTEQEKQFLEMKKKRGDDESDIHTLQFSLLAGKDVDLEILISRVKNGCQRYQQTGLSDMKKYTEYLGLLQFLFSATVCALERSGEDARKLLDCYDCFSFLQPSADVLKQYMLARCEEKSGAIDAASRIYQSLVSGESQVPVYEEWISCLETLGDNGAIVQGCISAADYYRAKDIKWREEYYEHKAADYMLVMANMDDIDVSSNQPDVEPQSKAASSKKQKVNRKNKAKPGGEHHATPSRSSQPAATTESVQSCPAARAYPSIKARKDAAHAIPSESGSTKNGRDYWRELNALFVDYYHLPHRYRDTVESFSREACRCFPNDIWVLHSAGWGFHLIGDEIKAAELLLKGLRHSLGRFPEVKSFIPVNIYGNFEQGLDRLKAHPEITPGSSAGLNVAAYLSSLAYVYRNLNKHCDDQMRSLANWLNPSRDVRKKEKQRVSFAAKVNVIPAEVEQVTRRFMAFGHGCQE